MQLNLTTDWHRDIAQNIRMAKLDKDPAFAERFRQLVNDKGWEHLNRVQLGKKIGTSATCATYYMNGDRLPSIEQARNICELLGGVCVEWLLTGKGQKKLGESSNLQNVIDATNLTTEQLLLIKGMIAQFEQSNPAKAENKSLTYPAENVGGGGVAQPSAAYDVKLPVQQAQAQDMREAEFSNSDSARYLALIKQSCIDHLCFCDKSPSPSPSPDLSYAAMIARTNLK